MRKHEIARITTMLLFVMLSTLTAFAQNITVKGVISDGQTNKRTTDGCHRQRKGQQDKRCCFRP